MFYFKPVVILHNINIVKNAGTVSMCFAVLAFLPNYVAYNSVLGTEIVFVLLLTIIVFLQVSNLNPWIKYPILGVFTAIAALTKPYFILYPIILFFIDYLKNKNLKSSLKFSIAILTFMLISILPFTYFNYMRFHELIPISYNGGYVLYINNNDVNSWGGYIPIESVPPSDRLKEMIRKHGYKFGDIRPELEEYYKNQAKEWITNHPFEFIKLGLLRLMNTYFRGAEDIKKWAVGNVSSFPTTNTSKSFSPTAKTLTTKLQSDQHDSDLSALKTNKVSKQRLLGLFFGFADIIVDALVVFGLLYIIFSLKVIYKGLICKNIKIDYVVSIPVFNILFFSFVYFVTEGQPRYNFPTLF